MNTLEKILLEKKSEVDRLKTKQIEKIYESLRTQLPPTNFFAKKIKRKDGEPLKLIAELKKASPSRGVLIEDFRPQEIAHHYARIGASAFSILTDEKFFQGSIENLKKVRTKFGHPILRKEFIIDETQIYESRLIGADAILLITAALDIVRLKSFRELAESLSMDVLVEVHDEDELEMASISGAKIIGVNNRNLKDFTVDISNSIRLKKLFPKNVVCVSESGLKKADVLKQLESAGFDAVLIGEGLISEKPFEGYHWKFKSAVA